MDSGINDRIIKIEKHVNERLRADLRTTLDEGDRIYADISEYLELKNLVEKLQDIHEDDKKLKTRVNIGCNVYAKGVIPSLKRIHVDIGLGFYLECEKDEALNIIKDRIALLNDRATVYKKRANHIKAQIKIFLEGLRKIQNMDSK